MSSDASVGNEAMPDAEETSPAAIFSEKPYRTGAAVDSIRRLAA